MKKLQCIFFITILVFTTLVINVNAQVGTEGNPFIDFNEVSNWAKYYRVYLMEKYDYYLVNFYTNPIRMAIPIYYHAISYNDDESEPDDVLKYWNRTSREIAMNGNFAKKTKEEQLYSLGLQRANNL